MVYTVKEFVDPFIANKNDKVDCLLSSLASGLHAEKIYMKPEDIILELVLIDKMWYNRDYESRI